MGMWRSQKGGRGFQERVGVGVPINHQQCQP